MNKPPHILIFSPSCQGGIAEYTFYQATALKRKGARVIALVSPAFLNGRETEFEKVVALPLPVAATGNRWLRKLRMAWQIFLSQGILAFQIVRLRPDLVLLDSYMEYLAPLWIDSHLLLSRVFGIRYGANLHDPVRSYAVGPLWWHRLSVWLAYQPLDFVLVHHRLSDPSPVPARVWVIKVPHGLYDVELGSHDASAIRREWGVQADQQVFLSFGYIRDGKNLELSLRALAGVKEAFLVVAGSVASSHEKDISYYHKLAEELGVADRCRFFEGYLEGAEIGRYFSGADFLLLTYSSSFHSQSGVLNLAAKAQKPVLASSSPSPLLEAVREFGLGIVVEPDSAQAVEKGMRKLLTSELNPKWAEYEASASWDTNAERLLQGAGLKGKE